MLYPGLVDALAEHEGIWLLAAREQEWVVVAGQPGTIWVGPAGQRLEGTNPLAGLPHPEWAARQVARVARFPHAGDLLLLGAWDGQRVITFEEQVASHGGLGGPQDRPFLAYPPGERLAAKGIENAEEVYVQLIRRYGHYE
jgi:hypothetical protein